MKKIFTFIVTVFLALGYLTASVSAAQDKYYVGNTSECRYTQYTCERNWVSFSDSKGCGCKEKYTSSSRTSSYYNSTTSSKNNYSTKTQVSYIVSDFIERLERKNYSDSRMTSTINKVISKLKTLASKNSKYRTTINYAINELKDYRDDYKRNDIIEDIENIFDRY